MKDLPSPAGELIYAAFEEGQSSPMLGMRNRHEEHVGLVRVEDLGHDVHCPLNQWRSGTDCQQLIGCLADNQLVEVNEHIARVRPLQFTLDHPERFRNCLELLATDGVNGTRLGNENIVKEFVDAKLGAIFAVSAIERNYRTAWCTWFAINLQLFGQRVHPLRAASRVRLLKGTFTRNSKRTFNYLVQHCWSSGLVNARYLELAPLCAWPNVAL